jgi:hypothetical protein
VSILLFFISVLKKTKNKETSTQNKQNSIQHYAFVSHNIRQNKGNHTQQIKINSGNIFDGRKIHGEINLRNFVNF